MLTEERVERAVGKGDSESMEDDWVGCEGQVVIGHKWNVNTSRHCKERRILISR